MKSAAAEAIALQALAWLAGDEAALAGLMQASGLSPQTLRRRAADPVFLGFALDFLMDDEARARAFADHAGLGADDLARARMALPGGPAPRWT